MSKQATKARPRKKKRSNGTPRRKNFRWPMGRPPKLTAALTKKICRIVATGGYIETAAASLGINKSTLHAWLRDGYRSKKPGLLRDFSDAIHIAAAKAELKDIAQVDGASGKHWQAAAWKLERKHPERWALRHIVRVEVENQQNALLEQLEKKLPPHVWRQVVEALHGIAGEVTEGVQGALAAAPEGDSTGDATPG